MRYGVPQVKFDPEKHKEWLYDKFGVKPMQVHMDLMNMVKSVQPKQSINQIITEVKEDTDNFIFETIKPWCEERLQRKICKADLEQALLMYYSLDKEDPEPTVFKGEER